MTNDTDAHDAVRTGVEVGTMFEYRGDAVPVAGAGVRGGNDAPVSESALQVLRAQRAETARQIGEHLYRLIMGGMVRDPAVVAACRPLYDLEQQILRMEAALGTSGTEPRTLTVPAAPAPPAPDRDEMSTAITPGARSASSGSLAGAASGSNHPDRSPHHAPPTHAPDRVCSHCRMPVKATDRTCPVCGRDTADALLFVPASAPADSHATPIIARCCVRCGISLRVHDRTCPVCGTAQ